MKQRHLFWKVLAAALAVTLLLAVTALAAGTEQDPLVTLSYLTGTYRTNLLSEVNTAIAAKEKQLSAEFASQVASLDGASSGQTGSAAATEYRTVELQAGKSATVEAGGEVLVLSGTLRTPAVGLTDVTDGTAVGINGTLTANHLYVASVTSTVQAASAARLLVK